MQLREFVRYADAISSWVLDVIKHFLLLDTTYRNKIGSD